MMTPIQLAELTRIAEWLAAECGDDERAFADTLAGCTNVMEALEYTHQGLQRDEELILGIKARMTELNSRLQRVDARKDAKRKAIGQILRAAGLKKAELTEATVSVREGKPKLVVADKDAVPSEYQRVFKSPDMAAIKEAFAEADVKPNWLAMEPATDILTIRSK